MSEALIESVDEEAALAWLESAGWSARNGLGIASAESMPERIYRGNT